MAKRKINKSQLIRDELEKNPKAKAMDIVNTLTAQGHKISPHLVYFVKGRSSARKSRKKAVVKAARAASGTGDAVSLIREVRELADRAGGYDKLKDLLDALAG